MNYRHGFHAGNFADILKHVILMRMLAHLALKPAPFRVLDTHAGSGLYDLKSEEAERTGEWRNGIGRMGATFSAEAEMVLAPWRAALRAISPEGRFYPGSPLFIREGLREQDRAVFNEAHPKAEAALKKLLAPYRDPRLAVTALDGYTMWKAQIPPKERRGMVLVDPPFEVRDEFSQLATGIAMMGRKWPGGSLAIWYPVKDQAGLRFFEEKAVESGFADILSVELHVDRPLAEGPLVGTGLLIANPPFTLARDMEALLPELAARLALSDRARYRIDWLTKS
ncbi:MAG: 23S rRNA (adenine(2030)-N(6))-methyltransferase RlmJ [Rhizobiales bacterium]|nr:23S rRNA (adenine(2030)-N(6))-methyltransferase RlmJ [Hyphomicrobiales bacterium]